MLWGAKWRHVSISACAHNPRVHIYVRVPECVRVRVRLPNLWFVNIAVVINGDEGDDDHNKSNKNNLGI